MPRYGRVRRFVPRTGLSRAPHATGTGPPGGATVATAMGDQGGFRDGSLTKVPAGRPRNPTMTNSTDIDSAQADPAM